jgi:hypothetical protein
VFSFSLFAFLSIVVFMFLGLVRFMFLGLGVFTFFGLGFPAIFYDLQQLPSPPASKNTGHVVPAKASSA